MWKTLSQRSLVLARSSTNTSSSLILSINKINNNVSVVNKLVSRNIALLSSTYNSTRWQNHNQHLLRCSSSPSTVQPYYQLIASQPVSSTSNNTQSDLKTPLNNNKKNQERPKNRKPDFFKLLGLFASGALAYFAISFYLDTKSSNKTSGDINYSSKNLPGRVKPSIEIRKEKNPGNIKITLYQYVTCPFCCKVRAYLDYYGYSYDIVEVNSINKKQTDWSSYKKVPILAIQIPSVNDPDKYEEEIMQLNDSTVIVSALETYRLDPSRPLQQIKTYFEPVQIENDPKASSEYMNKYFVMLYNSDLIDGKDISQRKLEREWREWVDKKFIHAISPNVYRSLGEAFEAFDWFSKAGDWENQFNWFERQMVHYIGAIVMFLIGKRLRSRHNLKEDVRESMYDYCNEWVNALNGKFKGGNKPNLADIALYGAIGSFKGCATFDDIMSNTQIKAWYDACRDEVENSRGAALLHNNKSSKKDGSKNYSELGYSNNDKPKKSKRFGIF